MRKAAPGLSLKKVNALVNDPEMSLH